MKHKVAILAGAGTGISFEIARQLAAKGVSALLNDIKDIVVTKGYSVRDLAD